MTEVLNNESPSVLCAFANESIRKKHALRVDFFIISENIRLRVSVCFDADLRRRFKKLPVNSTKVKNIIVLCTNL